MILVVGATGRLGAAVAAELLTRGHKVAAGVRDPSKAEQLKNIGARVVQVDLRRPEAFETALRDVTAVVTAVHGLTARAGDSIIKVDVEGHKKLIDAAARAGVSRFVFTSAQDADPNSPVPFLRAKAEVERHLEASGLDYTILRPAAFMDLYAHDLIGKAVLAGKPVRLLGPGDVRRNMVAVADVAAAAAAALEGDRLSRRIVEVAGPDNVTDREVAALYGRLSGKPVKISALPLPAVRVIATLIGPFHAGMRNILRFALALQGRDHSLDASHMPALVGRPPTTLEDFARARV
jgi:uncharacterized protein YbjT (DUF2867 family)